MSQLVLVPDHVEQRRQKLLAFGFASLASIPARVFVVSDEIPADGETVFTTRAEIFQRYPNDSVLIICDRDSRPQ